MHTMRMIYMVFEISCSILKKKIYLQFLLFQNSHFLGIFDFWLKNTYQLQKLFKQRPKSSICLNIFHISYKKINFLTLTIFLGPLTWNRPIMYLVAIAEPRISQSQTIDWKNLDGFIFWVFFPLFGCLFGCMPWIRI